MAYTVAVEIADSKSYDLTMILSCLKGLLISFDIQE